MQPSNESDVFAGEERAAMLGRYQQCMSYSFTNLCRVRALKMWILSNVSKMRSAGLLVVMIASIGISVCSVQASQLDEYAVKGVYLYQFSRYVAWPNDGGKGAFVIGIIGDNPLDSKTIATLNGKTAQDRKVSVRLLSSESDLQQCHILYVPGDDEAAKERLAAAIQRTAGDPVLVVAEAEDAAELGAAIAFVIVDSRVRFDINRQSAVKAQLVLSAKLLRVANSVVNSGGPGD